MENVNDIAKRWGIIPHSIKEIKSNVWKVETPEGAYALKRSTLSAKKLDFIGDIQYHLRLCGYENFAHPVFYRNSPYVVEDACYTLYDWVEGERCCFDDIRHLKAAARALAKLHLYSRDPMLPQRYDDKVAYFRWVEKIKKRIKDLEQFQVLAAEGDRTFFKKMYLGFYEPFRKKAADASKYLLMSEYPRIAQEDYNAGAFIHYDVAARNFIIQGENAYLIDFDYAALDLPLVDLMRLLKRSLKYGENAQEKINAIVSSYTAVRPLTKEHWEVLYALLLFPQKYWRLSQRYFDDEVQWEEAVFAKKIRSAVGELEREGEWLPVFREMVGLD